MEGLIGNLTFIGGKLLLLAIFVIAWLSLWPEETFLFIVVGLAWMVAGYYGYRIAVKSFKGAV